jgi:hypothetical protein
MRKRHRTSHWFFSVVMVVAGMGVGLMGCVEDRSSLTILRNAVPSSDCTVESAGSEFRSMGWLDLSETAFSDTFAQSPQYLMYPVVQNNLISTLAQGTGAELNIMEVKEARIDLDLGDVSGVDEDLKFKFPVFVTLFPGESATLPVVVIPPQIASVLAGAVQGIPDYQPIVRVKLKFLYQLGIREKESHQIEFPVVLCDGCLLDVGGYCDSGLFASLSHEGNACNYVQDAQVDCCLDNGGGVVCPAVDTSVAE